MSEFLLEAYVPRTALGATPRVEHLLLGADELTQEGTAVRLLGTIFVPEDEICFYLYQARSLDAVREAAVRAGLRFERISEAKSDWTATRDNGSS